MPEYSVSHPRFVAHDLDDHAAAMTRGRRVNAVDDLRRDIHRRVETEGDVRSPDIVIDRLGQTDDVHPSSASRFAVLCVPLPPSVTRRPASLFDIRLHRLDLVHAVFADHAHVAEGRAARAENRAAEGQNTGEIRLLHFLIVPGNQTRIAVLNADDLRVKHGIAGRAPRRGCRRSGRGSRRRW